MNNYKSVRNRLFTNSEVELKSEAVELGVGQDILKLSKQAIKLFDRIEKAEDKAFSAKIKYQESYDKLIPITKEASPLMKQLEGLIKKVSTSAKELGVKADAIPGFGDAEQYLSLFKRQIKERGNTLPKIK